MQIRAYRSEDCPELAQLFYDSVHHVCVHDYTEAERNAWATGSVDIHTWDQSFQSHVTLIAEESGVIIGFGDIDPSGYLDRLYVHKDFQRKGVATALCDQLEAAVTADTIITYASITSRPFFAQRGYVVLAPNSVERNGVSLKNYRMQKKK